MLVSIGANGLPTSSKYCFASVCSKAKHNYLLLRMLISSVSEEKLSEGTPSPKETGYNQETQLGKSSVTIGLF